MAAYNSDAIVVDPVNLSRSGGGPPETPLIFDLSGNLYLGYYRVGSLGNKAGIFRSTDGGATWDTPDLSNAPGIGNHSASYAHFGTTIYCAHIDGSLGNNWVIDSFDTVTDTYGAQIDLGINLFADLVAFLLLKIDSAGDWYILYHKDLLTGLTVTGRRIYFRKIIAGVIGPETLLSVGHTTADLCRIEGLTIDETDRVHVCFSVSTFFPGFQDGQPKDYYWTSISSGEVVATEVLLVSIASSYPNYPGPEPAVYLGQLIIFARDSVGQIVTHTCATGTDTPTFTDGNLGFDSVSPVEFASWPEMRPVVGIDGKLYVFYLRYVEFPFVNQINFIRSPDGLTWEAPSLWFNEVAHPVNPGQFSQSLSFLHAIVRASGDFVLQSNVFIGGANVGITMVAPISADPDPEDPDDPDDEVGAGVMNYCF